MDIRDDDPDNSARELFSRWGIVAIILAVIFTISMGVIFSFRAGVISSVSILIVVGVVTTDSWNQELKDDGYASLSQLYSSYLAVLFLFIALFPTLSSNLGLLSGIALAIAISLTYIISLNTVAFRGIDEHETAVSTYVGPSVVYIPDGPYFQHVEEVAARKKLEEPEE